jgi:hypothetical protein
MSCNKRSPFIQLQTVPTITCNKKRSPFIQLQTIPCITCDDCQIICTPATTSSGGGGAGSKTATYSLTGAEVVATTTIFEDIAYFPWKNTLYGTYTNGHIIFEANITGTNLLIQVIDGNTLGVLGGPLTVSLTGTYTLNFNNPVLPVDTFLVVQIAESSLGITPPTIKGLNMEFTTS